MKRFNLVVVCLVVLGLVASASLSYAAPKKATAKVVNANIEGKWYMSVVTPQGTGNPVFTFKQDGNKITGTYAGRFGEADVIGNIKGSDFTVQYTMDGKTTVYAGKVDGNKMSGTCDFAGQAKGTFDGEKIVK
jgi:hypothetical protein